MSIIAYIEPQPNYDKIFDLYFKDNNDLIYIPNKGHEVKFIEECGSEQSVSARFVQYMTIDAEMDSVIYPKFALIAKNITDIIRSASGEFLGDKDYFIPHAAIRGLNVTLMDRLVGITRPYLAFANIVKKMQPEYIKVIARPNSPIFHFIDWIKINSASDVKVFDAHLAKNHKNFDKTNAVSIAAPGLVPILPHFDYNKIEDFSRLSDVFVCANMRDKQYLGTAVPFMKSLTDKKMKSTLLSMHPVDDDIRLLLDLMPDVRLVEKGANHDRLRRLETKDLVGYAAFHAAVLRDARAMMATANWAFTDHANDVIVDHLARTLPVLLFYVREFVQNTRGVMARFKAGVVTPGRSLECSLLVGLARDAGLTTIEIQSGTISPTPRFVPPSADYVLCIDQFSADAYVKLGVPAKSAIVVGGLKIDRDLEPARMIKRDDALDAVKRELGHLPSRIMLLASQPVGLDTMKQVANIVCEACAKQEDYALIIKLHPNEDYKYADMYMQLATSWGVKNICISRTLSIADCIIASDIVATFYSTVGLEAFCLDRPVAVVNPFQTPPPYELAALGVAVEVKDASGLSSLMSLSSRHKSDHKALAFLRDGKSALRSAQFVRAHYRMNTVGRLLANVKSFFRFGIVA